MKTTKAYIKLNNKKMYAAGTASVKHLLARVASARLNHGAGIGIDSEVYGRANVGERNKNKKWGNTPPGPSHIPPACQMCSPSLLAKVVTRVGGSEGRDGTGAVRGRQCRTEGRIRPDRS
jgi:hypothetical protein